MVRHPESDILEGEDLGSIAINKASGCNAIPVELFKGHCHQSVVFNMSANLEDPAVATELEKVNPHPSSQEE